MSNVKKLTGEEDEGGEEGEEGEAGEAEGGGGGGGGGGEKFSVVITSSRCKLFCCLFVGKEYISESML